MARRYREWTEGRKLPPSDFFSLTENLRAARNKLLEDIPTRLHTTVLESTPKELRHLLLNADESDLDNSATLQPADKGRLKSKRRNLKTALANEGWDKMEAIVLLDQWLAITSRVLNPVVHGNESPLYEAEIVNALNIIRRFDSLSGH